MQVLAKFKQISFQQNGTTFHGIQEADISFLMLRIAATLYPCPDLLRFFKVKA